jgi:hypothetical protein
VTEKLLPTASSRKSPDAAMVTGKKRLLDENGVRFSGAGMV